MWGRDNMPYFQLQVVGDKFSVKSGGEDGSHLKEVVSSLAVLRNEDLFTDVVIRLEGWRDHRLV